MNTGEEGLLTAPLLSVTVKLNAGTHAGVVAAVTHQLIALKRRF